MKRPQRISKPRPAAARGGAHVTRLRLKNWRNFKNVDIEFGPRTFVVGPNASGKSNLLDALRFLRDIAAPAGSLLAAVEDRGGLAHLRSLHAGFDSRVEIEVDLRTADGSTWSYLLRLVGSSTTKRPLKVSAETVRHGGKEILGRRSELGDEDPLLLSQTHLEQASQTRAFRPLVDALASIAVVHVVPQVARTPSRAEELSRHEAPGSDFIHQIAKLKEGAQKRALARIEKLLRIAVPRFSDLEVERDDIGRPHLRAKYAHWRPQGGWQTERDFSDGTLRLIGLLWAIDQGTAPLILEEPELSLHRDVIRQIPQILASAAARRGRQVLVSSHAPELFDDPGVDPSEIVILTPTQHETTARLGSSIDELVHAAEAGLPLGGFVTSLTRPPEIDRLASAFAQGKA